MNQEWKDLFEYNFITNEQLMHYLQQAPQVPEQVLQLLSHIVNAHQIWLGRISNKPTRAAWTINTLHDNQQWNTDNYFETKALLEEKDLETVITYTNTLGIAYSNAIKDILFHIINHSTYHRAQIASLMKANGIAPLATDYVIYKRSTVEKQ
jgi:uncharacterized damage-inducible protein DinB